MENIKPISIIESIRDYYAFGTPLLAYRHPGFKAILEIVDKKIIGLQTGTLPHWDQMLSSIASLQPAYRIYDYSAHPVPSLLLDITQVELKNEYFTFVRGVTVVISLLAEWFTVYSYDRISPTACHPLTTGNDPSVYIRSVDNTDYLMGLRQVILRSFTNYKYVDYAPLFTTKIQATIPYRMEMEEFMHYNKAYPLGAFVFGFNDHFALDVHIIQEPVSPT